LQRLGQVVAGVAVDGPVEVRGNGGSYPLGHLVLLGDFVFFDFADLVQRLVELAAGVELLEFQEELALRAVAQPLGEALGVVGLEGVTLADYDDLFRREHRYRVAGGNYRVGDGGDVRVCREEDLLSERVVAPVTEGVAQEFLYALVLGEVVFADEGDNHGCRLS